MNIVIDFIDINIILNVEDDIGKRVFEFWKNCLDIHYLGANEEVKDAWRIYAKRVDAAKEFHSWDFEKKEIINHFSYPYDLTEINAYIRECITKIALYLGNIWVHGSCFRIGNQTVLILGEKNAGKTTWVLNAITNLNAAFIGNDQLPLFFSNGKLCTAGWRPDIKIRPDTLKVLGLEEKEYIQADRYYIQLNNAIDVDIDGLSEKNGYIIKQIDYWGNRIQTCFHETVSVDRIIYIGKVKENNDNAYLWKKVFDEDRENLLPHYLCDWCENMKYWTKRIGNVPISSSARNSELEIYNQLVNMPVTILDNRMSIDEINKFLLGNS